jgi:hypothetical protein
MSYYVDLPGFQVFTSPDGDEFHAGASAVPTPSTAPVSAVPGSVVARCDVLLTRPEPAGRAPNVLPNLRNQTLEFAVMRIFRLPAAAGELSHESREYRNHEAEHEGEHCAQHGAPPFRLCRPVREIYDSQEGRVSYSIDPRLLLGAKQGRIDFMPHGDVPLEPVVIKQQLRRIPELPVLPQEHLLAEGWISGRRGDDEQGATPPWMKAVERLRDAIHTAHSPTAKTRATGSTAIILHLRRSVFAISTREISSSGTTLFGSCSPEL